MHAANFNENPTLNGQSNGTPDEEDNKSNITEADLTIGVDGIKMFGYMSRKPTRESQNKKASSRVWKRFYVILKDTDLIFFRDEKEAKQKLKPIQVITAVGSQVTVASDYHKKKNVLRIALASGAEYLVQSDTADEMTLWIQNVRGSAVDPNAPVEEEIKNSLAASSPIRPLSVNFPVEGSPAQDATPSKKEKKRGPSLFGKKKKSKGETPTKQES